MKILKASQIKQADQYTIENEPISSINLMERASLGFFSWFTENFEPKNPVVIFCGTGNNGGDGLAISRFLLKQQYKAKVYIVGDKNKASEDFKINYHRLNELINIHEIQHENDIPVLKKDEIVIDAIFGSGLSRPVEGIHAKVIEAINNSHTYKKIAVDVASGLFTDQPSNNNSILKVDYTVTFQSPKLAFMIPENEDFTGELVIVNIQLSSEYLEKAETPYYFLTEDLIAHKIKTRKKFGHKGQYGRALIIAGSKGKMGAALLSAKACLRSGVGLLTMHTPKNCWPIMQSSVHEAMVSVDEHEDYFSEAKETEGYDIIGIGPGLGTEEITINGFRKLLEDFKKPMVFDADAINIIGKHPEFMKMVPENSIFTPHPKEFERLVGPSKNSFERLEQQIHFSQKHKVFVLLKGAHSSISTPEGLVYFNSTGNSGMATGGSGDILTGIITSLAAQAYSPLEATLTGTFIHGLAGDLCAEEMGKEAMLPSDLIGRLGEVFKYLAGIKNK